MKGFGKILVGIAFLTAALLLYVHEQVEMLRASYRIQKVSTDLSKKSEDYRRLTFEVAQLRSPQNLEKRLGELPLPLALPREIQVLRVQELSVQKPVASSFELPVGPSHHLFDFLGQWIQVAQARTDQ